MHYHPLAFLIAGFSTLNILDSSIIDIPKMPTIQVIIAVKEPLLVMISVRKVPSKEVCGRRKRKFVIFLGLR
jgi:hypothetical protein